ncbi:MAG: response regulator [Planctomycetota bacterium]|nr:MAG: response regulator [Planctomycetota bacterium]
MSTPRLQGKNVLIVDDDEDILSSIDLVMRAEGANTRTATDGNAALAAFDEGGLDAVVLDMMLPKRSGFVVLERLKKLGNPPVVVMITANMGKRHMAYAQDLGVDAYLVKPVPLQRLVDTVIRLLFGTDGEHDDATEKKS